MSREAKKFLNDIISSINDIDIILKDTKNFAQYEKSLIIRSAIERKLTIIGEAVVKLKQVDELINITNSKEIISLRNRLVHAYDSINNEMIWLIARKYMKPLKKEVSELLKK